MKNELKIVKLSQMHRYIEIINNKDKVHFNFFLQMTNYKEFYKGYERYRILKYELDEKIRVQL